MSEVQHGTVVFPGTFLSPEASYVAGQGVYSRNGNLFSSLAGSVVIHAGAISVQHAKHTTAVPTVGSLVTCKVLRISSERVLCSILVVDKTPLVTPFNGYLRAEDIRQTEIDSVDVGHCYRPNDVILAEILHLGDTRNYLLTTAKNHLGVVHGTSMAGHVMIPISLHEMQCTVTGVKEPRKVAQAMQADAYDPLRPGDDETGVSKIKAVTAKYDPMRPGAEGTYDPTNPGIEYSAVLQSEAQAAIF
eukprot:TRINITY_DN75762_c0_g1_i1.p1 TRINITY_DN75762_c0_g1~~TRINITY_DN75762_c0_g1_i1.p1  ORF type:complete len:261 (-),score=44.86 TRINITY_DN75762_c0_g1_i1:89-826(-)